MCQSISYNYNTKVLIQLTHLLIRGSQSIFNIQTIKAKQNPGILLLANGALSCFQDDLLYYKDIRR